MDDAILINLSSPPQASDAVYPSTIKYSRHTILTNPPFPPR